MIIYNEIDANAAQWMKNLAQNGDIPHGKFDERPIQEIGGGDLAGARQFHTFAGIGGWPLALRLAGWPEDREVWTGSCPCQPFSSAGKGKGVEDERHLWPEFFRLIRECRPATIFGEQVGSKAGIGWLDGVQSDLEGEGYTCGAVIMGAHSVGAPHIRQRLYWVASLERLGDSHGAQDHSERGLDESGRNTVERVVETLSERQAGHDSSGRSGEVGGMGENTDGLGRGRGRDGDSPRDDGQVQVAGLRAVGGLADDDERLQDGRKGRPEQDGGSVTPWSDYRIIPCTDGKARRTGARVFPLAYGLPRGVGDSGSWRKGLARSASRARIGMLRGSGNAIVPELAAQFISAFMEAVK